jgi:hypothetical protein
MIFTEVNTFISVVSRAFIGLSLNKWRRDFLLEIFMLYIVIPGRINFTQMSRYSKYCEQRFRNQFKQKFDFMNYNTSLITPVVGSRTAISFDPSYIEKSGKKTPYLGSFWSGSDQCTKKGLEIAQIALIDIDLNQSFHLEAVQTAPVKTLKIASMSLSDWYAHSIISRKQELQKFSKIVVADAFFSKITFIQPLMNEGFHVISKLRDDANLRYKFTGEYSGKGRPPHLAGKIDLDNLNLDIFTQIQMNDKTTQAFYAIVNSKSLKMDILLVVERKTDENGKTIQRLIFSSDTKMNAIEVLEYYHCRFQMEFNFRDAKQATGLNHCQARDLDKLDFHFNASLTTVNIMKIIHLKDKNKAGKPFSIADYKILYHNAFLLNRFIEAFGIKPKNIKSHHHVKELLYFGTKAA